MAIIQPHSVLLFQGDSITDAGRSRSWAGPGSPEGLGHGYVHLIGAELLRRFPDHHLQIYNRGISGDRIQDLQGRWEEHSLRLLPAWISILIGVNDTWNYLYSGLGADPDSYQEIYSRILEISLHRLPGLRLALCEPFLLPVGEVGQAWMDDIQLRQQIVRELAYKSGALLVPFQSALNQAAASTPPYQLLDDGVHPTPAGHQLLADCWLETVLGKADQ